MGQLEEQLEPLENLEEQLEVEQLEVKQLEQPLGQLEQLRVQQKKIRISIHSSVALAEDTVSMVEDTFQESGVDTEVSLNQEPAAIPEEEGVLVIQVFTAVDQAGSVEGSVLYGSLPLEELQGEQRREAEEILMTAKRLVVESVVRSTQPYPQAPPPLNVVISLKAVEGLAGWFDPREMGARIGSMLGLPSVAVLLNSPTEEIQGALVVVGSVPVLLDMKVGEGGEVSGNIYYNFVPVDQLEPAVQEQVLYIFGTVSREISQVLARAFQVTGPQVTGPEVTGPQVTGPQVTGPEVTGPEVTGPEEATVTNLEYEYEEEEEHTRSFLLEETTLGFLTNPEQEEEAVTDSILGTVSELPEEEPYPEPESGPVENIHSVSQREDEGLTFSGAAVSVLSDYSDYSDYRDFLGVEKAADTTVSPGSVQSVLGRDLGEIQEVAAAS